MTPAQKKLITQIVMLLIVFIVALFLIEVVGSFLSYPLVKIALAAVFTWAIFSVAGQIGLPGFEKKAKSKKK